MIKNRPPIVVVLGHVDHGKTSLLDALNKTNIAAREAGGITQSTRAFQLLNANSQLPITFIDTPGHAAFSQMRSRGGQIADIAILVVSAVDGVMPQTKESIETIQAAKIPMIIAINKMDVAGASAEKVKSQLAGLGETVEISAKTGQGLPELLDLIHLINDLNPAQADPEKPLQAIVLESSLDPRKGSLATLIIKDGTLHQADAIYLGEKLIGKARSLSVDPALPSTPVEVSGLSEVPPVGSILSTRPSNNTTSPPPLTARPRIESENLRGGVGGGDIEPGVFKIILKADVAGSLEAITYSLPPEVKILLSGTGDITESDILTASPLKIKVLGFNVRVSGSTLKLAEIEKVTVKTFNIIYELLDYVDKLVHPKVTEITTGKAEILAEFKMNGVRIAGCKCTEGQILKGDTVRVEGREVKIKSLHLGKTETEKVKLGQEFGVVFNPYIDFKVGGSIMAIQIHG